MACHLLDTKPFPELMQIIVNWIQKMKFQLKFNNNKMNFFHSNTFGSIVCKKAKFLFPGLTEEAQRHTKSM